MVRMAKKSAQCRPRYGVIGIGKVGSALEHVLEYHFDVAAYDIRGSYEWEPILETDAVFVCVQTPGGPGGRLDCTHVAAVLRRLSESRYTGVVAIRSTVAVGFMDWAVRRFSALRLVYFPEFIRERSRLAWTANPDRLVVAGARRRTTSGAHLGMSWERLRSPTMRW